MNFIEAIKAKQDGKRVMRKNVALLIGVDSDGLTGEPHSFCLTTPDVRAMLAEDWEIVPEPPKTMTFMEAMAKVRKGKKVYRVCWSNAYVGRGIGGLYTAIIKNEANVEHRMDFTPNIADIEATDWIVVED